MATERLPMRHIREILRLKWIVKRSHRETARSLGISAGVVGSVTSRAAKQHLTWAAVEALTDDALERALYGQPDADREEDRPEPDLLRIHQELRRQGVTLELLHVEYLAQHPTGYRYSAFCDRYRAWRRRQRLSMRQVHKAGEKAFVDYAGTHPAIVDAQTGDLRPVELFVAVLGASNYTFAEATRQRQSPSAVRSPPALFRWPFAGRNSCRNPAKVVDAAQASRAATSRACNGRTATGPGITTPS